MGSWYWDLVLVRDPRGWRREQVGGGCSCGRHIPGLPPLPPLPAPAPEPRGAAAPYKEASGSPAPGPCYIRAGLLYKARLVGRGVAGPGPGEGSTLLSPVRPLPQEKGQSGPPGAGSLSGLEAEGSKETEILGA